MQPFVYESSAARVLFGRGRISDLASEVELLGASRAFLVTTGRRDETGKLLHKALGDRVAATFQGAVMHTPTDVTARALQELAAARCDVLVALGGGSTIGLSKALALRTGLPQIVIPTTYAGSEVTPILGETEDGVKKTQRSAKLLPQVVIYDAEQTLSLSPRLSASSGLNAIAHAAEALYSRDRNPIVSLMATEGISALVRSLPLIQGDPANISARTEAQYGAWLCGMCLGMAGMALHHKLCHVLGGSFGLPHAETHAIVLPYALAYNSLAAPAAMDKLRVALGTTDSPWIRLHAFVRELGLPTSLESIGMPRAGLARALELILRESYWNPRPMDAAPLASLLAAAFEGAPPQPF